MRLSFPSQFAGDTLLKNEHLRNFYFFLYTLLIIKTYFFIGVPFIVIFCDGGFIDLIIRITCYWFFFEQLLIWIFYIFFHPQLYIDIFILLLLNIFFVYYWVIFFWIRRQTIFRAWLVALPGTFTVPGWYLLSIPAPEFDQLGVVIYGIAISLNTFFPLLLVGNYVQKRFWPDNRLVNRLRYYAKRPCLRS